MKKMTVLLLAAMILASGCNLGRVRTLEQERAALEAHKAEIRASADLTAKEKAAAIAQDEARQREIAEAAKLLIQQDRLRVQVGQDAAGLIPAPFGTILSGVLGVVAAGLGVKARMNATRAKENQERADENKAAAIELVRAIEPIIAPLPAEVKASMKQLSSPELAAIVAEGRGKTTV